MAHSNLFLEIFGTAFVLGALVGAIFAISCILIFMLSAQPIYWVLDKVKTLSGRN